MYNVALYPKFCHVIPKIGCSIIQIVQTCTRTLNVCVFIKPCLVWNMETKKCVRTFKHRHAITAVVMGDEMCISGCEAGKVKVWHLETGKLIKVR